MSYPAKQIIFLHVTHINTHIMTGLHGKEITKEDVRRLEHEESIRHRHGEVPANSTAAAMQSYVDKQAQGKEELIEERRANLPLPENPPTASTFNTGDASSVAVGSGTTSGHVKRTGDVGQVKDENLPGNQYLPDSTT
ncbi:hypothetical protein K470DRAFT_289534 [Piedraia hortae CBS 480.64]|uniref:Uncharacterized protein n=1 Tax=Piedraia hortae CBS 480.64 TaxID=1314780 RepID=A0A6A7BSZ3_9PEZI|nr:hypothetical protein K470DRAFT_289534 [Piedraia hortae CBS 480.64]